MIIKIKRNGTDFNSNFEIIENNQLKYLAATPHINHNYKNCIMFNLDKSVCYMASHNNTFFKLFAKNKKTSYYDIIDNSNNTCGSFYNLKKGFLSSNFVIEYDNLLLNCYDVSIGKAQTISIYKDDFQIGEIIKPLGKLSIPEHYFIFLLDEYSSLEKIISFFTIFFDYERYHNVAETISGEPSVEYTYSKNNNFFDKNWIANNFSSEEVDLIYNNILAECQ